MSVVVGEQIQASPPYFGLWTGNPTAFSFQWQDSLNGTTLNGDVSGETRSDYIVASGEEGRWLRVAVTASNAAGSSEVAYSAWYGPVGTVVSTPPVPVTGPFDPGSKGIHGKGTHGKPSANVFDNTQPGKR